MAINLIASASIQIQKPIAQVYEGIVNPVHMIKYFIATSNGRMEAAAALFWAFPEFPDAFPVKVLKAEAPERVFFVWDEETLVDIQLESAPGNSTIVRVTERVKSQSDENIAWVIGNSGGWANFLACLKAYPEYGINLRRGAFNFKINRHP